MNGKMKNIWFIFFSCILFSCTMQMVQDRDALYAIDVDNLEKQDIFYVSSVFKSVKTIILEEREDVVIGDIRAVQVFDNYIFVLDIWKAKNCLSLIRKVNI
jgi:hypothetical protein